MPDRPPHHASRLVFEIHVLTQQPVHASYSPGRTATASSDQLLIHARLPCSPPRHLLHLLAYLACPIPLHQLLYKLPLEASSLAQLPDLLHIPITHAGPHEQQRLQWSLSPAHAPAGSSFGKPISSLKRPREVPLELWL